eukprot:scaffold95797_cov28-Tisochrysis_lutea.AAC.4
MQVRAETSSRMRHSRRTASSTSLTRRNPPACSCRSGLATIHSPPSRQVAAFVASLHEPSPSTRRARRCKLPIASFASTTFNWIARYHPRQFNILYCRRTGCPSLEL